MIPSRQAPITPELLRIHREEEEVIDAHLSKLAREIHIFRHRKTGVKKYDVIIKGFMIEWELKETLIRVSFEHWSHGDRCFEHVVFPTAYLTEDWMELEKAEEDRKDDII